MVNPPAAEEVQQPLAPPVELQDGQVQPVEQQPVVAVPPEQVENLEAHPEAELDLEMVRSNLKAFARGRMFLVERSVMSFRGVARQCHTWLSSEYPVLSEEQKEMLVGDAIVETTQPTQMEKSFMNEKVKRGISKANEMAAGHFGIKSWKWILHLLWAIFLVALSAYGLYRLMITSSDRVGQAMDFARNVTRDYGSFKQKWLMRQTLKKFLSEIAASSRLGDFVGVLQLVEWWLSVIGISPLQYWTFILGFIYHSLSLSGLLLWVSVFGGAKGLFWALKRTRDLIRRPWVIATYDIPVGK